MPWALAARSTITAQPGLHNLYSTGSGGGTTAFLITGRTGFALFTAARLAVRFTGRVLRRPADRLVRVARIASALTGQRCNRQPVSRLSNLRKTYLRRSTMYLSVRLLLRVFLPNVGKAQGVCG